MARLITAFLFVTIIIYGSSCSNCTTKTVQCPAYSNTNFSAWFPYHDSQTVVFKNNVGITDTLFISSVIQSPANIVKGMGVTNSSCYSSATIIALNTNGITNHINLNMQDSRSYNGYASTTFMLDSVYIYGLAVVDTGINMQGPNPSTTQKWLSHSSVNTGFNGKVYDSLQKIYAADAATAAMAGSDTIYLAKNYGIIGFSKYPAHVIYAIQ